MKNYVLVLAVVLSCAAAPWNESGVGLEVGGDHALRQLESMADVQAAATSGASGAHAVSAALLTTESCDGSLPEGSFKGTTPSVKNPDVMALFLKKDPANKDSYYAILAEYDRMTGRLGPDRLAITRWVPRMYAYRVDKISDLKYAMKPLYVSTTGDIKVDGQVSPDSLSLAKLGTLDGAVLTRYFTNSRGGETIRFKGKIGSTWENYVAGNFLGSTNRTGGDYFKKGINMTLSQDGVANFMQEEITGQFDVSQKAPGMYTFTAKSSNNKGNEKVVTRIGVFVDIVNWKPLFTTNELLLINPDNAEDVGFYYERH